MVPRSLDALRHYSLDTFRHDLVAGVTVGLVALPLAMAFAVSAGVPPQAGLSCAVIAGFVISALGGSRFQIGGPTGAFVVVVAGIVGEHGLNGLLVATMLGGAILVVMGATGLGSLVRFIPQPVILGFTNGIAVTIATTQVRDFFGLQMTDVPGAFVPKMRAFSAAADSWNGAALLLAASSVVTIVLWRRLWPRIPAYIVVLVGGTAIAAAGNLPVETIGSRFGGIQGGLPPPQLPHFTFGLTLALLAPALTIAMLGAVESLLSAVVADRMGGDRHEPNVELVAQGVANLAAPLFGGLPATGAIARTATNIRSGARTPIAGVLHALTLLAVLLVAAPVVRFVPLSILAGILVVVAYQMGEWGEIRGLLRLPPAEVSVWAVTFGLTVIADLTVAVEIGLILAMFLALRRLSETTTIELVDAGRMEDGRLHILHDQEIPGYVTVFRIYGPLLFGTTSGLLTLGTDATLPEVVILKLRHMTALDATGLHALEQLAASLRRTDRHLIVCGASAQPAAVMAASEFASHVGAANVCANINEALVRARTIHEGTRSVA